MVVSTVTRSITPGLRIRGRFFSLYGNPGITDTDTLSGRAWGTHYDEWTEDGRAVIVSEELDQVILDKLLAKYELVTVASLRGYLEYMGTLKANVPMVMRNLDTEEVSVDKFIELIGRSSGLETARVPNTPIDCPPDSHVVYLLGSPEVMLSLWSKYTDNARLDLYAKVEGGVQHIDLSRDITELCTRYEILQSVGCIACPARSNCPAHLLEAEVSPIYIGSRSLKKVASRLGIPLMPPSDCISSPTGGRSIDITDIRLGGAEIRHAKSKKRRKQIEINKRFYKDNCSSCPLESICGTRKTYNVSEGAISYCSGKLAEDTSLAINVDNYIDALKVLFSSLFTVAGKDLELVIPSVELVRDWVETECSVPNHASYFITKFNKARKMGIPSESYYVIPRQLVALSELINLSGSFDGYNSNWYSHGIGSWLSDSTSTVDTLLPLSKSNSGWVAILGSGMSLRGYTRYSYYNGISMYEYVDTKVLYSIIGAKSSYKYRGLATKQSRLQLALEFIKAFLSPGLCRNYGPFGSKIAWAPEGMPPRRKYSYTEKKYVMDKVQTNLEIVSSILTKLREVDDRFPLLKSNNALKEVLNG